MITVESGVKTHLYGIQTRLGTKQITCLIRSHSSMPSNTRCFFKPEQMESCPEAEVFQHKDITFTLLFKLAHVFPPNVHNQEQSVSNQSLAQGLCVAINHVNHLSCSYTKTVHLKLRTSIILDQRFVVVGGLLRERRDAKILLKGQRTGACWCTGNQLLLFGLLIWPSTVSSWSQLRYLSTSNLRHNS